MIVLAAQALVAAGAVVLATALFPVRQLMRRLPPGPVRSRWRAMTALIVVFLFGYVAYAAVLLHHLHWDALDLIVPVVFFLGACFVWLSVSLSLRTTIDVMRMRLLEQESVTDSLTGILNRRYLDRRLAEEVASARRYGLPLSLMVLDVDHFKQINDTYGHSAGDAVLAELGKVVAEDLRESDVLARYGGEEFAIVTPHTALAGAADIAERVRRHIESHAFAIDAAAERHSVSVTASIGLASFGENTGDADKLVRAADDNLYRAKRQGRNRIVAGA